MLVRQGLVYRLGWELYGSRLWLGRAEVFTTWQY